MARITPFPRQRPPKKSSSRPSWVIRTFVRDFLVALAFVAVAIGSYSAWKADPEWLSGVIAEITHAVSANSDAGRPTAGSPSTSRYGALPLCGSGRRVTCIVDGDTGWLDGENWRLTASTGGVDAPEISKPECAAEKRIGERARDRLRSLMSNGYHIERGRKDRYGRTLMTVILADGRDAGAVLIAQGLAQPWPNTGNRWCGR
jgi:endonuclease YncB( thermonuclease family)